MARAASTTTQSAEAVPQLTNQRELRARNPFGLLARNSVRDGAPRRRGTTSTLRQLFLTPVRASGIALFVAASFGGTTISSFIDCSDSFWAVACGVEAPAPQPPTSGNGSSDEVLGISIVLGEGMVCTGMGTDAVTCLVQTS